jgi:hypothetical protein
VFELDLPETLEYKNRVLDAPSGLVTFWLRPGTELGWSGLEVYAA